MSKREESEPPMRLIRRSDLAETPWRNGGGVTREIAEARRDGQLLWRLSMADVASDGPFSDFSGLMRVLTVIEGAGMDLITPEGVMDADFGVPVRFDGGLAVTSRLKDGPLSDLNLMFDPRRVDGTVEVLRGPAAVTLTATPQRIMAWHCLTGTADLGTPGRLQTGDTAVMETGHLAAELAEGAAVVQITLDMRG